MDCDANREVHLVDFDLRGCDNVAHRHAIDNCRYGDDALAVFTLDCRGSETLYNGAHILDAHTFAARVVDENILNVGDRCTVLGCIHHLDVIFLTILAELGCSGAVDAVAQIGSGSRKVKPVDCEFFAVEIHLILGLILVTRDFHVGSTLDAFEHSLESLSHRVGLGEVVAVDFIVDCALTAHAAAALSAHVHLRLDKFGIFLEVLAHESRNFHKAAVALGGIDKAHIHRHDVCAVVLHRGKCVIATGLPHGVVEYLDFGIFGVPFLVEAVSNLLGNLHSSADRKFERHTEARVVACGDKFGADKLHESERSDEERNTSGDGAALVAHNEVEQARIAVVESIERFLDRCEEYGEEFSLLGVEAEHLAAKHRSEREGASGGDNHHDTNHPTELLKEHTHHAGNHSEREEHRQKCERRCHNRDSHLVGAVDGSLLRVATALDVSGYVLENHNGIVNHHTDRDGERRERHDVERVACGKQVDE